MFVLRITCQRSLRTPTIFTVYEAVKLNYETSRNLVSIFIDGGRMVLLIESVRRVYSYNYFITYIIRSIFRDAHRELFDC